MISAQEALCLYHQSEPAKECKRLVDEWLAKCEERVKAASAKGLRSVQFKACELPDAESNSRPENEAFDQFRSELERLGYKVKNVSKVSRSQWHPTDFVAVLMLELGWEP